MTLGSCLQSLNLSASPAEAKGLHWNFTNYTYLKQSRFLDARITNITHFSSPIIFPSAAPWLTSKKVLASQTVFLLLLLFQRQAKENVIPQFVFVIEPHQAIIKLF